MRRLATGEVMEKEIERKILWTARTARAERLAGGAISQLLSVRFPM